MKKVFKHFIFITSVYAILTACGGSSSDNTPPTTPGPQSGTTYYVSTTGNDRASGDIDHPFATIKHCVNKGDGNTCYLRAGIYNEYNIIISNNHTTVLSYPGESVIVDGAGMPNTNGTYVFWITGRNNALSGVTIQNSGWYGLYVSGDYNTITNVFVQHSWQHGILVTGTYNVIDNCDAYYNCKSNEYAARIGGTWAAGMTIAYNGDHSTIKNSRVWNNWGEGLSTFKSTNTTLEHNTVWDNYTVNLYIDTTVGSKITRNYVYLTDNDVTTDHHLGAAGHKTAMSVCDETGPFLSSDNEISYNVMDARVSAEVFTWLSCQPGSGLVNFTIANNTIVGEDTGIYINDGYHSGTVFKNNIVYQRDGATRMVGSANGITYSNNLWNRADRNVNLAGIGDIIGDPLFVSSTDFHLRASSPCIDAGTNVGLTTDYDGNVVPFGAYPNIGAYEYQ